MMCAGTSCGRQATYVCKWKNVFTVLCYLCGADARNNGYAIRTMPWPKRTTPNP